MKIFKKICLLSLFLLPASYASSYSVEQDIVRRYQQEVLQNARYNNYKDSRKKFIQSDIDDLRLQIDSLRDQVNEFSSHVRGLSKCVRNLEREINSCKNKRTELDGKLAELMCLDDLGDSTARKRMSALQQDISLNEYNIKQYESQKDEYNLQINDLNLKINELNSEKLGLEKRLRDRQRELSRL